MSADHIIRGTDLPIEAPLVSIVTPSLNQGAFIEDTVVSVLRQDHVPLEYVVIDGGSKDQTVGILERYRSALRFVSEPDRGQAAAINKGFRLTGGRILAWLNSDDVYEPGAVSAAVAFLRERPELMLVYGDATLVDVQGRVIGPCAHVEPFDLDRLVHHLDFIVQPAAFFRREAFEAVGGLDESLHWSMDYDLWLKIARRFPVAYLPRKLARYRWTGENKTSRGGLERYAELERLGRRHGAGGLPADFRLEKLALLMREAGRRARGGELRAAAGLALAGAATMLSSPRALKRLGCSIIAGRLWSPHPSRKDRAP
jgi:glycosyltransferase involved in cell wall biosynthesis